ncbi:MAG: hypothetical protein IKH28_03980 [Lachnospiraceae bacterium]|nr:hypothetical protein [Lachnospiraceae bacterium]
MRKFLQHLLLAVALVFGIVLLSSDSVQAAPKPIRTYSDFPVKCSNSKGAFSGKFTAKYGQTLRLQGWVAADEPISEFTYRFELLNGNVWHAGLLNSKNRPDVKAAYPKYKYCLGFEEADFYTLSHEIYGASGTLKIFAKIGSKETLIGTYAVSTKDMMTCSDLPITIAPQTGTFYGQVWAKHNAALPLKGWVAANASITSIWGEFYYFDTKTQTYIPYILPLKIGYRPDVKKAYPQYSSCVGYELDPAYTKLIENKLKGISGTCLYVYAMINGKTQNIGLYDINFQ